MLLLLWWFFSLCFCFCFSCWLCTYVRKLRLVHLERSVISVASQGKRRWSQKLILTLFNVFIRFTVRAYCIHIWPCTLYSVTCCEIFGCVKLLGPIEYINMMCSFRFSFFFSFVLFFSFLFFSRSFSLMYILTSSMFV